MENVTGSIKKVVLVYLTIVLNSYLGIGQEHYQPPIPVEVLMGNDAVFSQLVLNRDFAPQSKFSLFSLATYTEYYNKENENDLAIINQITYDLGKGFGFMAGVNVNAAVGLTPVLGPKYVYVTRKFLAVSILSYSVKGDHDISFFGLYEFTPPVSEKLSLYTRFQVLYNRSLGEEQHNRSFMYLRAGLKKSRLNFGFGANFDQYGPDKDFTDNYGAFVGWDF